jgi:hypothetical protein
MIYYGRKISGCMTWSPWCYVTRCCRSLDPVSWGCGRRMVLSQDWGSPSDRCVPTDRGRVVAKNSVSLAPIANHHFSWGAWVRHDLMILLAYTRRNLTSKLGVLQTSIYRPLPCFDFLLGHYYIAEYSLYCHRFVSVVLRTARHRSVSFSIRESRWVEYQRKIYAVSISPSHHGARLL